MRLTQIHRFPERLLSTVQRGTAFEYRSLALLTKHMSMSLTRVGGSYDGGVDLIGWWWVPSSTKNLTTTRACRAFARMFQFPFQCPRSSTTVPPYTLFFLSILVSSDPLDAAVAPVGCTIANRRRLRVLAQCKAEKKKMGPAYLRELEGVVSKYAAAGMLSESSRVPKAVAPNDEDPNATPTTTTTSKEPPPIALLVSESAFTRHCLLAAHASPLPFLLVHLPPPNPPPSTSRKSSRKSSLGGGSDGSSSGAIGAIFGNPALISANGVLGGELEIRWEHGGGGGDGVPSSLSQSSGMLDGAGRPRLWWQGQPLPSWTPEAGAVA
jgi:hypothetical protein